MLVWSVLMKNHVDNIMKDKKLHCYHEDVCHVYLQKDGLPCYRIPCTNDTRNYITGYTTVISDPLRNRCHACLVGRYDDGICPHIFPCHVFPDKQMFNDNEYYIRKDEKDKIFNKFTELFWSGEIPDNKVDFVEYIGKIIRTIRDDK